VPEANVLDTNDAWRDVPIPSIEFPETNACTDGARLPLARPVQNKDNHGNKDKGEGGFNVIDGRGVWSYAQPVKRQQTVTTLLPVTKGEISRAHDAGSKNPFEALMQKGRVANKIHSSHPPVAGHYGHRTEAQQRDEARRKAAAAAQQRPGFAGFPANGKRHRDEEQESRNDRAVTTTKTPIARPPARVDPFLARPRLSAPAKLKASAGKQSGSILSRLGADAKRAKERRERDIKARNERSREVAADIRDLRAQRGAEANHALSRMAPHE
jgi:hypothetical protein